MSGVFDQARACISPALVEAMFGSPGAYWAGGEFWTLNPARADGAIGSFSISDAGLWHDFASGESGDAISLIVKRDRCTKIEAAEAIIKAAGGIPEERARSFTPQASKARAKANKPKPVIPAPEEALKLLNSAAAARWAVEKHGTPVKGWTYRTAEGAVAFAVTRHEKPDGSKDVLPWYYGEDCQWHCGHALEHGRPIYKLDQIVRADKSTPILIVEGEKCASIDVRGYLVVTWAGGCSATERTDWSPLEGRDVIIWPDADRQKDKAGRIIEWAKQPGMKAALAIASRLPGARVLDVEEKAKVKNGWDLADAIADGVDPLAFIAAALPGAAAAGRHDDGLPFLALGHDAVAHYYMRRELRIPFAVARGAFTQSKLLEIAPLSWYGMRSEFVTKEGGLRVAQAQDYMTRLSLDAGGYDQTKLRGAGVWRDRAGIILNDGLRLIALDGSVRDYDDYKSDYIYIKSSVRFGSMSGPESTDEDGRALEELFKAQSWAEPSMAPLAMGWSLIAAFGGMLQWRPHIWVTGRKGSGKSWMLENLIAPLCGPFAHRGSGKDTEAGIRRSLNLDARPVILDEMEPKSQKAREKIGSILELARNASSDGSGVITMSSADGNAVTFVIRSCFAFASVQVPDEDAATASRIIRMELRTESDQEGKFAKCAALYAECMQDPTRYTRRIYRALPRILQDIEWLRGAYLGVFGEQRKIDQFAPLLASAWAAQSTRTLEHDDDGREWLARWIEALATRAGDSLEDEDEFMRHLVASQIRIDDGTQRTVAELLIASATGDDSAGASLSRHGIRIVTHDGYKGVAISTNSQHIRRILSGTTFESGYAAPLRRNKLCIEDSKPVRFACGRSRACILEWGGVRSAYLDEASAIEPQILPF